MSPFNPYSQEGYSPTLAHRAFPFFPKFFAPGFKIILSVNCCSFLLHVFRIHLKSDIASNQSQDGCPDSPACFDGSGEHNETDEHKAKGKIFLYLTGSAKYPVGGMSSAR